MNFSRLRGSSGFGEQFDGDVDMTNMLDDLCRQCLGCDSSRHSKAAPRSTPAPSAASFQEQPTTADRLRQFAQCPGATTRVTTVKSTLLETRTTPPPVATTLHRESAPGSNEPGSESPLQWIRGCGPITCKSNQQQQQLVEQQRVRKHRLQSSVVSPAASTEPHQRPHSRSQAKPQHRYPPRMRCGNRWQEQGTNLEEGARDADQQSHGGSATGVAERQPSRRLSVNRRVIGDGQVGIGLRAGSGRRVSASPFLTRQKATCTPDNGANTRARNAASAAEAEDEERDAVGDCTGVAVDYGGRRPSQRYEAIRATRALGFNPHPFNFPPGNDDQLGVGSLLDNLLSIRTRRLPTGGSHNRWGDALEVDGANHADARRKRW